MSDTMTAKPGAEASPSAPSRPRSRAGWVIRGVLLAALVVLAIVFRHALIAWFSGGSIGGGSTSPAAHVSAGGLSIDTSIEPDPPRENGDRAHVLVRDAHGKPVTGAKVRLEFDMPAMGAMQAMHGGADATEYGGGRYTIPFDLGMSGSWTISIHVAAAGQQATARYTLRVGSSGLTVLGGEATGGAGSAAGGSGGDILYYTCSMHPSVHANAPGKCPICGMTLTPVTRAEEQQGVITIDDGTRKQLGITTTKVVREPMNLEILAKGKVTVDEKRQHDVTLKIGGYISDLVVNTTGQMVHRGDRLFTLYSPDLYAAEQEYLIARDNTAAGHLAGEARHNQMLLDAAETKLRLWGLGAAEIRAIAAKGAPIEHVPFTSPATGVVIEKNVVDGAAVTAGQRLFRISDLSEIWVEADVYEADLPRIKKDMPATITLDYLPGKTFSGKVAFVYPYLDPVSRAGRVRIALANPGTELKPDMFATVKFEVPLGPRLVVPISSVVYTGPRRLVFLDLGHGQLRPQEVTIGARTGDKVEILRGLKEGETVVSSGNFLVAAESRIRSAGSYFWRGSDDQH